MFTYFFVLGRAFDLCKAELEALLNSFDVRIVSQVEHVVLIDSAQELPLEALVERSGGIVKAGRIVDSGLTVEGLPAKILELAQKQFEGKKFRYGASVYGSPKNEKTAHDLLLGLNRLFDEHKVKASYVFPDGGEMSSVQIEKYHLFEDKGIDFVVIYEAELVKIGITHTVQPFDIWSRIDYGRPQRDPKSGMLPPKVARMMVHIGLGAFVKSHTGWNNEIMVNDPFCGSGTVITEAMRMGCRVGGSDISEKAVLDSQANVAWLLNSAYYLPEEGTIDRFFGYKHVRLENKDIAIHKEEVAHIDKLVAKESVQVIATEPYLGPPFSEEPTPGKLDRIIKGLEKMYIGALSTMKHILAPEGVIVFAEPIYYGHEKTMKVGIIDNTTRFGYTLGSKIVEYKRERSFVGRRIGVLIKK